MATIDELLHALRPLEAIEQMRKERKAKREALEAAKPKAGLDSNACTFARHAEDYDHVHVFDYEYQAPGPHERRGMIVVTGCTVHGCGVRTELPLAMFTGDALDMVAEEIESALSEEAEERYRSRKDRSECERSDRDWEYSTSKDDPKSELARMFK